MTAEDAWAPLAERFVDKHYASLRGRVRTYVIDRHLHAHLPPVPASLIDVGGGAGTQSIPLARAGYRVTIVDPSEAMLHRAALALAAEPAAVAGRVRLIRATAGGASHALGGERFAGVLCHGVIMYVEEPRPFLAALAALLAPGGVLSLVAKNAACLAVRPALEGRWDAALAAFDTDRQVNGLGVSTRADSLEDVTDTLAELGVARIEWYGVRLFSDGWTRVPEPPDAPDVSSTSDAVFAVEFEASRRDPYRQLSRLFHYVGRRR